MTKLEKINKLANSGAYLRKNDHIYVMENGSEIHKSVTNVVESQFPYFDKEKIAKSLTVRAPKYQHLTWEELVQEWNDLRDHGTLVHEELELYIKNGKEPRENKSIAGREWYDAEIDDFGDHVFSEITVYDEDLNIAGTVDLLVYNSKTNKATIIDWKTSKKIDHTSRKNAITDECYGLKASRFDQYSLQLSFYSYLLEKSHGIEINNQYLAHLMEYDVDIIKASDYTHYVKDIVNKQLK